MIGSNYLFLWCLENIIAAHVSCCDVVYNTITKTVSFCNVLYKTVATTVSFCDVLYNTTATTRSLQAVGASTSAASSAPPAGTSHIKLMSSLLYSLPLDEEVSICQYQYCHLSYLSPVTCHCHLSPVTCHLSPVTCHLSPVTCPCHLSYLSKKLDSTTARTHGEQLFCKVNSKV